MGDTSSAAALTFATVLVVVALYEFAAIRWRRVPTITEIIKNMPLPARAAVIAAGVAAWLDHFWWGVWL